MQSSRLRSCLIAIAAVLLAAACGGEGPDSTDAESTSSTTVARAAGDPRLAGDAISGFGNDLFAAVAAEAEQHENVVISPASIAIALAMLEPGAIGDAQTELRKMLRIEDTAAFHTSMGALEQSLEHRQPDPVNDDEKPGEITVRVANAAYVQRGYRILPEYLSAVERHYGPVVERVDFSETAKVAAVVNEFVSRATEDLIEDIVDKDDFSEDSRLALVNALYLKASWIETFAKDRTETRPFTRLDGSKVSVPLMHDSSDSSAKGDHWVGATKGYVGGLAVQFILPDEGEFDAVAREMPEVLAEFKTNRTRGAELAVPRFKADFNAEISPPLTALGLRAPYASGHLMGIADDEELVLAKAIHATHLSMDEEGTEAAAATVLVAGVASAPAVAPVRVILDRPFIFRIYDERSGATLFIGRVMDPTA